MKELFQYVLFGLIAYIFYQLVFNKNSVESFDIPSVAEIRTFRSAKPWDGITNSYQKSPMERHQYPFEHAMLYPFYSFYPDPGCIPNRPLKLTTVDQANAAYAEAEA